MDSGGPESALFRRTLVRALPRATRGEGSYVVADDGRRWLDASGGAAVANLGHGGPFAEEIAEAVADAIRTYGYLNGTQFTHGPAEELARELALRAPGDLDFAYFLASGSEAIEAAVKLARQLHVEGGESSRWKVISRVPSYHGNTLAALSLSAREHYRTLYGPLLTAQPRVPAPDPYRDPGGERAAAHAVEEEIVRQGPETVAAVLAEPIGGSSSGAVAPSAEYWRIVAAACERHGVLLIADEVMCGMGRTGHWYACEHYGLVPDILVLGKGLNAGALALSALLVRRPHVARLAAGSGAFVHAQTYSHHPAHCAAGLATVRILARERLIERAAGLESGLRARLETLRRYPVVGDVRGRGALFAIEFVADRESRTPFERRERFAERFAERAFAHGLIVWPSAGTVGGEKGDVATLAPPFTIAEDEMDEMVARLAATLEEMT
ncbi:MAG: aminotransferase class III-fold pyridoxal phosphate-dependent enzyme [Thermoanaerobaculia bacterium]